jgi:hypothetical protein
MAVTDGLPGGQKEGFIHDICRMVLKEGISELSSVPQRLAPPIETPVTGSFHGRGGQDDRNQGGLAKTVAFASNSNEFLLNTALESIWVICSSQLVR